MKHRLRFALLLPAAALIGCTLSSTSPTTGGSTPTGTWDNWQIQAGTAITSPPNSYPSFLGAVQVQGTQTAGIFTTVNAPGTPTPSTVLDYAGSFTSLTGNVTLATYGFGLSYLEPAAPYTLVPVGVIGGCVYPSGYLGPECLAIFTSPSVGVQIAPLIGTYTGSLLNSSSPNLQSVSLSLTQSTTPNANGEFPVTGTLVFLGNVGTYPVTGTVSGEGISLSYFSAALISPSVSLTASTNPTGTQLTVSNLTLTGTGPPSTFTGMLTRQ